MEPHQSLVASSMWLLILSLCLEVKGNQGMVQCYVCSWSPKDNRSENWCSDGYFRSEMANLMECSQGCEYVYLWDNNNAEELFHRNCYGSNETLEVGCREVKNIAYRRKECVCNTDYCNDAVSTRGSTTPAVAYFASLLLLLLFTTRGAL